MMFEAQCTACSQITPTPVHYEGISIKCVHCGHSFVAVDPKERLFKFHCSCCGGKIQAREKLRGTMAPCPHCSNVVPVGDYNMDTRPLPEAIPIARKVDTSPGEAVADKPADKASTSKLGRTLGRLLGR